MVHLSKRRRRQSVRAGLLSAIVTLAVAPAANGDDLLQIYRRAVLTDTVLRGAVEDNRAVAEERRQAAAGFMPTFGLTAERKFTDQEVKDAEALVFAQGGARFPTTNVSLTLTQPVMRFEVTSEYRRADARVHAADAELARVRQELIVRTAELYFDVLTAEDEQRSTRSELTAVEREATLVEARHASGLAPVTDLRDAQARRATTRALEVEVTQRLDDAREALAELLDELPGELMALRPDIVLVRPSPDDPEQWVQSGLTGNPAVVARRHELEAARHEVKRRRSGHLPTLDFQARYNRNDSGGSLFGGGSDVETRDLSLLLNVPIFAGGRVSSEVRQAAALLGKTQEELDRAMRAVKRQVRNSFQGVSTAIVQVESLKEAVASQRLARAARAEGHRSGLFTLLAVLDAERDLARVERQLARARYDYILEGLRLKQAAGTLRVSDLEEVNAWLR